MKEGKYTEQAETMKKALTAFSEKPDAIENFCYYLENHFDKWLELFANTPDNIASEFLHFSSIE